MSEVCKCNDQQFSFYVHECERGSTFTFHTRKCQLSEKKEMKNKRISFVYVWVLLQSMITYTQYHTQTADTNSNNSTNCIPPFFLHSK
jgi:hypothetical protein